MLQAFKVIRVPSSFWQSPGSIIRCGNLIPVNEQAARMDIAKQYVQNKNMDLTEIAFLLGFAEQSTFSRSFKRWTGKSPIQYRKAA